MYLTFVGCTNPFINIPSILCGTRVQETNVNCKWERERDTLKQKIQFVFLPTGWVDTRFDNLTVLVFLRPYWMALLKVKFLWDGVGLR